MIANRLNHVRTIIKHPRRSECSIDICHYLVSIPLGADIDGVAKTDASSGVFRSSVTGESERRLKKCAGEGSEAKHTKVEESTCKTC